MKWDLLLIIFDILQNVYEIIYEKNEVSLCKSLPFSY
jgi:hypothetical protein